MYYWIASVDIKTLATKNRICACKMRGEGNMPLNDVNVGKDTKMCFPTTGVP
jgi:hypothetical protein